MQDFELRPVRDRRRPDPRQSSGQRTPRTFWSGLLSGALAFVLLAALTFGFSLMAYASIAGSLPEPENLTNKDFLEKEGNVSIYQSTRILDRNGQVLNELFNPDQGRRTEVPLGKIPDFLQKATISTEDANFYKHQGIDFYALTRALYYAVRERNLVSGGSTIPQQLVKLVLLSPERTMTRKIREAILAAEISRRYPKDKILELYLNQLYYGNFAYGVEAAAETYFNKPVADLTLGEASMLAGLPQAPAYYDPYRNPDNAKKRQAVVLSLMVENGYITAEEADAAYLEKITFVPLKFDFKAPHFTLVVRQQLEEKYGSGAIYQLGYNVYTSLDLKLQEQAEQIVKEQVGALNANNVSNGALVAMNPRNGEVLALVGSADFDNVEIDGQVNMAVTPRQPGSTMKPLVYLASFENPSAPVDQRWTPGTLVADILEEFPDGANPAYVPTDYDHKERGLVTVRTALANSLNIPAVHAMQTVGVPNFLSLANRLGIDTLKRPDYGLALSLGAGEVPLIQMTGAFAVIANRGVRVPPVTIVKITDNSGKCVYGTDADCQEKPAAGQQVINPVDAFLLTDILSDNEARTPIFGPNSSLKLNRPAAAKTGTTNDIRDILAIGFTPQLVTGVWVGNADNSPMVNVSGVTGAAPIWNLFMNAALADQPVEDFTPPPGVKQFEVCADTGTLPSPACPEKRVRWYAEDRPPLPAEKDLYQLLKIDKGSGKLANEFTPPDAIEERPFKVYPEKYRKWAEDHGIAQPPSNPGDVVNIPAEVAIRSPLENETVGGVVSIMGSANVPDLASWELQYGISHDPGAFSAPFAGPFDQPVLDGALGTWDTRGLGDGPHTLRLLVRDRSGAQYEARIHLFVTQPTEAPTVAPTATPLPAESPTDVPTVIIAPPTDTPVLATDTPIAVDTATPLPTDTATLEPAIPTDTPLVPVETPTTEPTVSGTDNNTPPQSLLVPQLGPLGEYPQALLTGPLLIVNGCLRINTGDGTDGFLVLWPSDVSVQYDAGAGLAIVLNQNGEVVGRSGQTIHTSGGDFASDQRDYLSTLLASGGEALNACPGPYWLAGPASEMSVR
ncbi:MAG: PBP1A family penicillin-binding protein [Caldilineaceae bacterium]